MLPMQPSTDASQLRMHRQTRLDRTLAPRWAVPRDIPEPFVIDWPETLTMDMPESPQWREPQSYFEPEPPMWREPRSSSPAASLYEDTASEDEEGSYLLPTTTTVAASMEEPPLSRETHARWRRQELEQLRGRGR
jgi:hypothetical protein